MYAAFAVHNWATDAATSMPCIQMFADCAFGLLAVRLEPLCLQHA